MRWKSEVKHAELTPARTWSKRDEGNFGGRSLLTPDENELAHYGVPGMRWGVQTKEYIKKGYDTLKRRQAILKQKRKAEAKANYQEGYHRGQRTAANTYFIKNKVNPILEKKREKTEGSRSDRAINKAVDYALKKTKLDQTAKQYGLDAYIPMAKDFLKSKKGDLVNKLYDDLRTEEGQQRAQKVADFLAKGISRSIGAGESAARVMREGGSTAWKAVKSGARTSARAIGSSVRSAHQWLHTGNPTGAQRIRNSTRFVSGSVRNFMSRSSQRAHLGAQNIHIGAREAKRQLNQLLNRRHRRA